LYKDLYNRYHAMLTLGAPSADVYAESVMLDGVSLIVGVARR
jgi:hypothetical protein